MRLKLTISKTTLYVGIAIIISASFVRQLRDFSVRRIGNAGFLWIFIALGAAAVLVYLWRIVKEPFHWGKLAGTIAVIILGIGLAWQIELVQERIHILEYGILGWLACRDLTRSNSKTWSFILAVVFCCLFGAGDEAFQAVLPYRYFDVRDIFFNSVGGVWGTILYLLR